MSAISEPEVLDLLTRLVEKSLVLYDEDEQGKGRYRLLETVRQYGREKLAKAGEREGVSKRHLDFYLSIAEEGESHLYGGRQVAEQQRLERDYDNLRAALEWSLTPDEGAEAALRLVGALGRFWQIGSHLREGAASVSRALARGRNAPPLVLARAMLAGWHSAYHCDPELASSLANEALQFARASQDRETIASALFTVAMTEVRGGEPEMARASAEEGVALYREGERADSGFSVVLALAAWMRGDYAASRALFQQTMETARELGDEWHIAMTLANLGVVTRMDGDCEEARALHQEGLAVCRRLGDRRGIAWHLVGKAGADVSPAGADRAARLLGAAAALLEATGSPLQSPWREDHDLTLDQARGLLGEEAFAAAWAEGRAMTLEQAIAYALGEDRIESANPALGELP